MSKFNKIKRAVVGGYIKADMTGMGDWEVGRITRFDDKFLYFRSMVDGEEAKIIRDEAYKATSAEHAAFAKKQDADIADNRYDTKGAGLAAQQAERDARAEEKEAEKSTPAEQVQEAAITRYKCEECKDGLLRRLAKRNEQGHTHRCSSCGDTRLVNSRNLLEDYMTAYEVFETRTPTGRRSQDCSDGVAEYLRGREIDWVYELASKVMLDSGFDPAASVPELQGRYEHLNIGMQRMNLGNRIRAALRETNTGLAQYA